jgi:hypothetical protein
MAVVTPNFANSKPGSNFGFPPRGVYLRPNIVACKDTFDKNTNAVNGFVVTYQIPVTYGLPANNSKADDRYFSYDPADGRFMAITMAALGLSKDIAKSFTTPFDPTVAFINKEVPGILCIPGGRTDPKTGKVYDVVQLLWDADEVRKAQESEAQAKAADTANAAPVTGAAQVATPAATPATNGITPEMIAAFQAQQAAAAQAAAAQAAAQAAAPAINGLTPEMIATLRAAGMAV